MKSLIATLSIIVSFLIFICPALAEQVDQSGIIGHEYQAKTPLKAGDIGPDGNLVIYSWRDRYRTLDGNYGLMIWYNQYQESSVPEYELFNQAQKTIDRTKNLSEFLKLLSQIPKGASVYFYDLCSAGSHYGLDHKILKRVKEHIKNQGAQLFDPGNGGYVICTCPF
jgi:hypothetical protein